MTLSNVFFFFFQAEDGIRDYKVTGVQTCALPIWPATIASLRKALPDAFGLLDAPVQGSLDEAKNGSLRIWVGGGAADAERGMPLLSALGSPLHVGPLGAGASAKPVTNSTLLRVVRGPRE